MSEYDNALRQHYRSERELTLVCPECLTANRSGNRIIEIGQDDVALCGHCGKVFMPDVPDPPKSA